MSRIGHWAWSQGRCSCSSPEDCLGTDLGCLAVALDQTCLNPRSAFLSRNIQCSIEIQFVHCTHQLLLVLQGRQEGIW